MNHLKPIISTLLVVALLALPAHGQPSRRGAIEVPELLDRLAKRIEADPADAEALYEIGRVHAYAYAFDWKYFPVEVREGESAPRPIKDSHLFPEYNSGLTLPVSAARLNHLAKATRALEDCVALDSVNPKFQLAFCKIDRCPTLGL